MKKICLLLLEILLFIIMPLQALANSSWHWLTIRPWDLLPIAVVITLLIETLAIAFLGRISDKKWVFIVVCIANLFSFLAPYVFRMINYWSIFGDGSKGIDGPYYIVGTLYLILTILIELPVVYAFLVTKTESKIRLIYSIVLSNIITTALTYGIEKIFCHGTW